MYQFWRWRYGRNVASVGWQVKLRDLIRHVSSHGAETDCNECDDTQQALIFCVLTLTAGIAKNGEPESDKAEKRRSKGRKQGTQPIQEHSAMSVILRC